ncbi:MAG: hypothetical protein J0M33_13665 [Anaerolineae bacterium]|nr:hypothetical protein [Anaerolineae bacterium]
MGETTVHIELPQELVKQVQDARLNLRQIMIDALQEELSQHGQSAFRVEFRPYPSDDEIEQVIKASIARMESGVAGQRVLGLHAGSMWMSDDFDAELPDEFWFGEGQAP